MIWLKHSLIEVVNSITGLKEIQSYRLRLMQNNSFITTLSFAVDMMSPGSVLSDIETVAFNKNNTVQPQLEMMTVSVQKSECEAGQLHVKIQIIVHSKTLLFVFTTL